jgi:hypothetical protein
MTSMTGASPAATLSALCCVCGEIRTVSQRGTGTAGFRMLRCVECKAATDHAVVQTCRNDYREEDNRKNDGILVKIRRDLDHMERLGIWVEHGKPQGGMCMINHYLERDGPDEFEWRIVLADSLNAADMVRMLEWAWKTMLPSWVKDYDASWKGEICRDEYGDNQGCYYTLDP